MKKLAIPVLLSSLFLGACFGEDEEKKAEQEAQQQIEEIQSMIGEIQQLNNQIDKIVQAQMQNEKILDASNTFVETGLEATLVVDAKVKKEEAEKLAKEFYDQLKAVDDEFTVTVFVQQNDKELLQYTN